MVTEPRRSVSAGVTQILPLVTPRYLNAKASSVLCVGVLVFISEADIAAAQAAGPSSGGGAAPAPSAEATAAPGEQLSSSSLFFLLPDLGFGRHSQRLYFFSSIFTNILCAYLCLCFVFVFVFTWHLSVLISFCSCVLCMSCLCFLVVGF